jgi:DNA-binding CsgD family transcriptional regulator
MAGLDPAIQRVAAERKRKRQRMDTPLPADSEEQLWHKIHRRMEALLGTTSILYGFTHTKYLRYRVGFTGCLYTKRSHPADYVSRFDADSFLDDDICALILLNQLGPFFWSDAHEWDGASEAQKERARIDRECGMDVGVSYGFNFADGHGIAGIGLASRWMAPEDFKRRWQDVEKQVFHYLSLFDPLMRDAMTKARLRLTQRQLEVLRLSVGGMIGKEIAAELGISEGRIERIFGEIRLNMQASTTIEAAAKAIAYRLI